MPELQMKRLKYNKILILQAIFLLVIASISCVKFEPVSPIPSIEFKELRFERVLVDSTFESVQAIMEFNFVDGDADLGVYDEVHSDIELPDSQRYGIFVDLLEKVDGVYIKRYLLQPRPNTNLIDTVLLHQLLPYDQKLDRVGQNKTVKGVIRSGILVSDTPYDTMAYEFFIRDRALNKSNVERTSDFTLDGIDTLLLGK